MSAASNTVAGALSQVCDLVAGGQVAVLSGAGISTESGIPDYRGASGTARRFTPMTYQTFMNDPDGRRRYWARSHLGWQFMAMAEPNAGHRVVAALEQHRLVTGVITQNVDGLHTVAGSHHVIDLHGRLDRVICVSCRATTPRSVIHDRLVAANTEWSGRATAINPDGDVELPEEFLDGFTVVECTDCGGLLKPDVVYFGENVPADRVTAAYELVEAASSLLVLGSSLHVFSGRRFVVRAAQQGKPVVIINDGPTRGDGIASVKVDAPLGATLQQVVEGLAINVTR